MADHPQRGCRCPHHEAHRRKQRAWRAAHPGANSAALRRIRESHVGCYCASEDCPRIRVELAIARDPRPSSVMAATGCTYETYRAVLGRMSVAA